jgi:hypothetical protein
MKFILIPVLSAIITICSIAQDCTGYHQFHCLYGDYTFFYSRQSKSTLFKRGQTSEFKIIAYGEEDYYISVCAHRKFGDLRFRIIEDNEDSTLIYDNAEHEYKSDIIFTNKSTRNLIIEISVPPGNEREMNERRCVGLVVEFRKTNLEAARKSKKQVSDNVVKI